MDRANCKEKFIPLMDQDSLSSFLIKVLLPLQLLIGVFGNSLNLFVLNSRTMRSKTNLLLSCLAASDLLCLLLQSFNCIASFDFLATNRDFRKFYFAANMPILALSNWMSVASIW